MVCWYSVGKREKRFSSDMFDPQRGLEGLRLFWLAVPALPRTKFGTCLNGKTLEVELHWTTPDSVFHGHSNFEMRKMP